MVVTLWGWCAHQIVVRSRTRIPSRPTFRNKQEGRAQDSERQKIRRKFISILAKNNRPFLEENNTTIHDKNILN